MEFKQIHLRHYSLWSIVLLEKRIIVRKTSRLRLHLVLQNLSTTEDLNQNSLETKVEEESSGDYFEIKVEGDSGVNDAVLSDSSTFSPGLPGRRTEKDPFEDREVDCKDPNHDSFAIKVEEESDVCNAVLSDSSTFGPGPQVAPSGPAKNCPEMSGTTIISLHVDGSIYGGADGRLVSAHGRIIDEYDTKLCTLYDDKVLGTTAGRSDLCEVLLAEAEKELIFSKGSPTKAMAELNKVAEKWLKEEAIKGKKHKCYPSQLGLCGFAKDEPYFFLSDTLNRDPSVRGRDYDVREITSDEGKKATVLLSGLGSKYAGAHLERRKEAIFEKDANILELILESLAYASILSPSSGGNFQTVVLKNRGGLDFGKNRTHLICQILKSFPHLHVLKLCLIHVTKNALFKVCGGKKDKMNKRLKEVFHKVLLVNVIGVHPVKKITVRLLMFASVEDKMKAFDDQNLKKTAEPIVSFLDTENCRQQNLTLTWSLKDAAKVETFEDLAKEFKTNSSTS